MQIISLTAISLMQQRERLIHGERVPFRYGIPKNSGPLFGGPYNQDFDVQGRMRGAKCSEATKHMTRHYHIYILITPFSGAFLACILGFCLGLEWCFPKMRGVLFGDPHEIDYSILGSLSGSSYPWKLENPLLSRHQCFTIF